MSLLCPNSPLAPSSLRIKSESSPWPKSLSPVCPQPLSDFMSYHCPPSLTRLQPCWPTCSPSNISGSLPLQSLCTCCSHCLEQSSSQVIWWLARPLPVCSNDISLENHSLTSISKLVPFTCTFDSLILLYVLCFSTKN